MSQNINQKAAQFEHSVKAALSKVHLQSEAFINGRFARSCSGKNLPSISPINGSVICRVSACDELDIDLAVTAARNAFDQGMWSNASPNERKRVMLNFADLLEANLEELALIETLDMGKPIAHTRSADLPGAIRTVRYYAEAIDKIYDEIGPSARDAVSMIVREPLGVIGAIIPWNFPLLMAAWKFAPALAAGNSIILKPAEQSSLSLLRVAELASEAGIPPGVFNVVPGLGEKAGKSLALHNDVDAVVFTGSTAIGKLIMGYAASSNMKRVALECGGKSPQIVMADCPDFEAAAKAAAWAVFYDQGQVCTAGSRLMVQSSVKEAFLEKVLAVASKLRPGNPLIETTEFGALVDQSQLSTVMSYIERGTRDGASLICGGGQSLEASGGFYVSPTIFDGVSNDMTIAQEEIFGPVLSILAFDEFDEAITMANDSQYGLAAGIWTSDVNIAHYAGRRIRAGNVWINCWDGSDITTPFGGFKQSGFGRDRSLHALDKYTELKTIWLQLCDPTNV